MCLEAIWGHNIQTLNCVGYDHNWVKQYVYDDDSAPLLPKGTIVHLVGFLDTTRPTRTSPTRGTGPEAAAAPSSNMFIDLGYSVTLTEEQFQEEMAKRRAKMKNRNDFDVGCPLCWAPPMRPRHRQRRPAVASARCVAARRRGGLASRRRRSAQTRFTYLKGQGCRRPTRAGCRTTDGSCTMYYGYMNTNWLQEFDIPIGPDNSFSPAAATRTRASRRTSIRAAIRFCSPSRCRRTSAPRSSGR